MEKSITSKGGRAKLETYHGWLSLSIHFQCSGTIYHKTICQRQSWKWMGCNINIFCAKKRKPWSLSSCYISQYPIKNVLWWNCIACSSGRNVPNLSVTLSCLIWNKWLEDGAGAVFSIPLLIAFWTCFIMEIFAISSSEKSAYIPRYLRTDCHLITVDLSQVPQLLCYLHTTLVGHLQIIDMSINHLLFSIATHRSNVFNLNPSASRPLTRCR